jgi:hypothetical protein
MSTSYEKGNRQAPGSLSEQGIAGTQSLAHSKQVMRLRLGKQRLTQATEKLKQTQHANSGFSICFNQKTIYNKKSIKKQFAITKVWCFNTEGLERTQSMEDDGWSHTYDITITGGATSFERAH